MLLWMVVVFARAVLAVVICVVVVRSTVVCVMMRRGNGPLARRYIDRYAFRTLTTADFIAFFKSYFTERGAGAALAGIDWAAWTKGLGGLPVAPAFDQTLAAQALALADAWLAGGAAAPAGDFGSLTSKQKVVFFDRVLGAKKMTAAGARALGAAYGMAGVRNAEVRFRWQRLCLQTGVEEVVPAVVAFLSEQGRMKCVRPRRRVCMRVCLFVCVCVYVCVCGCVSGWVCFCVF